MQAALKMIGRSLLNFLDQNLIDRRQNLFHVLPGRIGIEIAVDNSISKLRQSPQLPSGLGAKKPFHLQLLDNLTRSSDLMGPRLLDAIQHCLEN